MKSVSRVINGSPRRFGHMLSIVEHTATYLLKSGDENKTLVRVRNEAKTPGDNAERSLCPIALGGSVPCRKVHHKSASARARGCNDL